LNAEELAWLTGRVSGEAFGPTVTDYFGLVDAVSRHLTAFF